jgi:hypothetical protein
MGTTLTGTKPKDTYDSLIKVTDNGPISGTAKYLSDGLGNDSKLALSTGNVGIGTDAPAATLDVVGSSSSELGALRLFNSRVSGAEQQSVSILMRNQNTVGNFPSVKLIGQESTTDSNLGEFIVQASNDNSANLVEIFRTAPAGAGGAPFLRMASGTGGIQFNGDTAAANALDDYEEGTWTPTFTDTLGNDVTATNVGRYTKIGRQVTLSLTTTWSNKGAAGAGSLVYMSGVPFNMNNKANGIVTYYDDMNLTTVGAFTIANAGTSLCYFPIQDNAVEASFLTFGETTNTSTFWFTLTYFV